MAYTPDAIKTITLSSIRLPLAVPISDQLTHPDSTDEQREEARLALQKLPRDASPVRVRNRDQVDG